MSGINGIIKCNMSCECSLGNKLDTRPSTELIASSMLYHGSNWHCGMKRVWLVRLAKESVVITHFKASLGWLRVFEKLPLHMWLNKNASSVSKPASFQYQVISIPGLQNTKENKCLGYCESALNQ